MRKRRSPDVTITQVEFRTPDAPDPTLPMTFTGAVAVAALDLIEAGDEGVTLAYHDDLFTGAVQKFRAAGLKIEVTTPSGLDWTRDARGATFVLKSVVTDVSHRYTRQFFDGKPRQLRREPPTPPPWNPFRAGRR